MGFREVEADRRPEGRCESNARAGEQRRRGFHSNSEHNAADQGAIASVRSVRRSSSTVTVAINPSPPLRSAPATVSAHSTSPPPHPPATTASPGAQMSDGAGEELSDRQKREIAVWFLSNAPAGEIHYVAKGNPPTQHPPLPPDPLPCAA
ncbi:hypothetical protein ABZP36_001353 [Zizania latifolia]